MRCPCSNAAAALQAALGAASGTRQHCFGRAWAALASIVLCGESTASKEPVQRIEAADDEQRLSAGGRVHDPCAGAAHSAMQCSYVMGQLTSAIGD